MEFSFKNRKKKTLRVEMGDGTMITLPEPRIKKFKEYSTISGSDVNEIVKMCTEVLNTNLEGVRFSAKDIISDWTVNDITDFMRVYTSFAAGIKEEKN